MSLESRINELVSAIGADIKALVTNKLDSSAVSAWAEAATKPTYTATEVGLGNVDNTSDATKNAATATLTNKTLTAPVLTNPAITGPVLVTSPAGLGYGTGAGGTVDQYVFNGSSSQAKNLVVTLNKPVGKITTGNAALSAGAVEQFSVSNSLVAVGDIVTWCFGSSTFTNYAYNVHINIYVAGGFTVTIKNVDSISRSEVIPICFAVIKGVTA